MEAGNTLPAIFDPLLFRKFVLDLSSQKITMPETLYEAVVEVEERVVLLQESCKLHLDTPIVTGNTGEKVGERRGEGGGEGERVLSLCI